MADLIQDAEKVASAVSSATSAVSTVETVAGGAAKLVTTAAGGLLTGLMPYLLGVGGAILLGLLATVGFDHYVTIPHLEAQDAIDKGALTSANAATTECNASQDALRAQVDQQNAHIADLQKAAVIADAKADQAAAAIIAKPLPPPPKDQSAASINAYLSSLRSTP